MYHPQDDIIIPPYHIEQDVLARLDKHTNRALYTEQNVRQKAILFKET